MMFEEMKGNKLVDSEEQVLASKLQKDRHIKNEGAVKCLHLRAHRHGMNQRHNWNSPNREGHIH